jgi:hypothetical protein
MTSFIRKCAVVAALSAAAIILPIRAASAQDSPSGQSPATDHQMPGHDEMPGMMQHQGGHMMGCPGREQMQGMMQHDGDSMMGCPGREHMQNMMQREKQSK